MAGVSSFGVGGTNCHIVLEEASVPRSQVEGEERAVLLTFSAKSEQALTDLTSRYRQYFSDNHQGQLSDIAFTSNIGRSHYDWRLAVVGITNAEFCDRLDDENAHPARSKVDPANVPHIGFLFTGQGAQYPQMARQLYDTEPEFRRILERCHEVLRSHLDQPLLDVLYYQGDSHALLDRTDYTQPALFAVEYALAELWRSWGIEPSWVMGHSVGEYVAACVAGVFSLEDGLRLVAERGRLMNALRSDGCMVSVFTDHDQVAEAIQPFGRHVSVAALNSPNHVVISGGRESVQAIVEQFQKEDIHCRDLHVSHAFHSPLIEPVLEPLERYVEKIPLQRPGIGFISNVSGRSASDELITGAYWRDHSRFPVQFGTGVKTMAQKGCNVFIEIGPHAVLTRFARETLPKEDVMWLSSLDRNKSNWHSLSEGVGQLYMKGENIEWSSFHRGAHHRIVRIPTYPFQRERMWIDREAGETTNRPLVVGQNHNTVNPMLGQRLRLPDSDEIRFETHYSRFSPSYLQDHRLFDTLVVPGASHVSMILQAAEQAFPQHPYRFEELVFIGPIYLTEETARCVQLVFSPDSINCGRGLKLMSVATETGSLDDTAWSVHMTGRGNLLVDHDLLARVDSINIDAIRTRATQTLSGAEFYDNVWGNAAGTGNVFKWIDSIWKGEGEAIAKTACPVAAADGLYYRVHPGIFEAGFQVLHCCKTFETVETVTQDGVIYVPFSIDELFCYTVSSEIKEIWCYAKLRDFDPDNVVADLYLSDQSGRIMVEMIGLCLRKLSRSSVIERVSIDPQISTLKEHQAPTRLRGEILAEAPKDLLKDFAERPTKEQRSILLTYLQQQVIDVSGFPESKVDLNSSLVVQGFDSLMAIMIGNRIKSDLSVTLPIARLLSSSTILSLTEELHQLWLHDDRQKPND